MATNDAISQRYEMLKRQQRQQSNQQVQQETEALKRRFASLGALGSGAQIKTEQLARQQAAKYLSEGEANLGIAESYERQQQQELEKQRAFQTSERLGTQQFTAEQAGLGRQFTTSERLGGQDWKSAQDELARRFTTSERLGTQQFTTGERVGKQQFETGERLGAQEFMSGQNSLERGLKERALTEQERAAKVGEQFQEKQFGEAQKQFGMTFEEGRRQAQVSEAMTLEQIRNQVSQFARQQTLAEKVANAEMDNQNILRNWQIKMGEKEYKLNEKIANANINAQKKALDQGDRTFFQSIYGENNWISKTFGI